MTVDYVSTLDATPSRSQRQERVVGANDIPARQFPNVPRNGWLAPLEAAQLIGLITASFADEIAE